MKLPSKPSTSKLIQVWLSSAYKYPIPIVLAGTSNTIRINHAVYTYDQFLPGPQYARKSTTSIQDSFDVILDWEDPEKGGGVVALLSKWTTKEKASGEEMKKTNVILWEVKVIDGKRKLTGQTEVEVEG
jgi:hypothetical protein